VDRSVPRLGHVQGPSAGRAVGKQQGGVGVARVVQSDHRQPVLPQCLASLKDLAGRAAEEPLRVLVGAVEVAENERRVPHQVQGQPSAGCPAASERSQRARGQVDDSRLARRRQAPGLRSGPAPGSRAQHRRPRPAPPGGSRQARGCHRPNLPLDAVKRVHTQLRHDALAQNPVRVVGPTHGRTREAPRALTLPQLCRLRAALAYDDRDIARDVPDRVIF
jgi:hypothetical protein